MIVDSAMKIRLVDVDSKMANIALMKVSSFFKSNGHDVGWYDPLFDRGVDMIFASKLFDFTPDYAYFPPFVEIYKGGTGYDVSSRLPDIIDSHKGIDYSIYPDCDYSMQFFSRGCVRNCPFCVVRQKEGYIRPVDPMPLNPKGKRIEVLDNHFFGNPEWRKSVKFLEEWGQPVNLHGVDVRMLTEEQADVLNGMRHYKQIHIAWDNPKTDIPKHIKRMLKHVKPHKVMCYVLIGFNSTPEEDLHRVEILRGLKVDPFVMPFNKSDPYQRRFARWVNHKATFKSVKWKEYVD